MSAKSSVILKNGERMTMEHLKRHIPEVAVNILLDDYELLLKSEVITKREVTRMMKNLHSKILKECLTKADAEKQISDLVSAYLKSPEFEKQLEQVIGDKYATKQFVLNEFKKYQTKLTSSTVLGKINGKEFHYGDSITIQTGVTGDFVINGSNPKPVNVKTSLFQYNGKEVATVQDIESKVEAAVTGSTAVKEAIDSTVASQISQSDTDIRKNIELLVQNEVTDPSTDIHQVIVQTAESAVETGLNNVWDTYSE